jgi:toxin ParE1/3/4
MKYILSKAAEEDIDAIFDYGKYRFGQEQAINYLIELESLIQTISENPDIGRLRNEIKKELQSFPFQSHIIFYRNLKTHIRIIRILHGSRDLPSQFSKK